MLIRADIGKGSSETGKLRLNWEGPYQVIEKKQAREHTRSKTSEEKNYLVIRMLIVLENIINIFKKTLP